MQGNPKEELVAEKESAPHPVDIYVGKRLRMRRTILGMSQEAVGNAIGVTFQQIQKYERGINRMGASRLYDFSRVLGIPVSFFFDGYGEVPKENAFPGGLHEDPSKSYEPQKLASRETLELMRAYYRIPESSVRKRVFELIKALAGKVEA